MRRTQIPIPMRMRHKSNLAMCWNQHAPKAPYQRCQTWPNQPSNIIKPWHLRALVPWLIWLIWRQTLLRPCAKEQLFFIWGFLKWGYTSKSSILDWDFPWKKPSSYYPHDYGTHYWDTLYIYIYVSINVFFPCNSRGLRSNVAICPFEVPTLATMWTKWSWRPYLRSCWWWCVTSHKMPGGLGKTCILGFFLME